MNTIIAVCTAVFILLIGIIIRQAVKIGTLESSLKNEDKSINSLLAKLDIAEQEHSKAISSSNQEREESIDKLNNQIKVLNEKLDDKHDIVIPSFKSHW
jgi:peptidoglycan hydrolase CwlO-like protein